MSVIPLTVFFSLLLAGLFIVLFSYEQRRRRFSSAESDSLLPLADEQARLVEAPATTPDAAAEDAHDHDHDHAHGDQPCGCRTGLRPPCVGCLKRTTSPAL